MRCMSCQKMSPSPSPRKSPSSTRRRSPNYSYNLRKLFGENPRNTRKTSIPPLIAGMIANKLKKGKNVKKLAYALPESYARYVSLRKPPATKGGSLYRAKRKAGNVRFPYNKRHVLDVLLPAAYKRNNWTHYSINGPLTFFNANGTPFSITKKGTRKAPPRFVLQGVNVKTYERKPGNNWASYQKRANKYTRYVRGAQTRRNILDEIEEAILGGAPNKYLYNANEVQNKWIRTGLMEKKPNANKYRWTNRALLFYLAKRHSNNYGKVPGYGITRRNGPIKMTRANILENLKMLHPFISR